MTSFLCDSRNRQNVSYSMSQIIMGHTPLEPTRYSYKAKQQDTTSQPKATEWIVKALWTADSYWLQQHLTTEKWSGSHATLWKMPS